MLLIAGLVSLSGCGHSAAARGVHRVELLATSSEQPTQMTVRVDGRVVRVVNSGANRAVVTVPVRGGHQVEISAGLPPGARSATISVTNLPSADTLSCTISVDGASKANDTSTQGPFPEIGVPLPECATSAYVGYRPVTARRVLEIGALGLCLLIVAVAIGAQLVPNRH